MRTRMICIIASAWSLVGCAVSEPPREVEAPALDVPRQSTDRWLNAGTLQYRTVRVDLAGLTRRADTVRAPVQIMNDVDTAMREFEIACATQRFRPMDRERGWQPIRGGLAGMVAGSVCADSPPR